MNGKVQTYIGFAIRKGSVVFGCDSISRYRKKMYLLLATPSLSENSLKILRDAAEKKQILLLQIDECDILSKRNCKALAICDKSLADAITRNL